MSNLQQLRVDICNSDIATSSDGEWLIGQLQQAMESSVRHVVRMASIVRRLDELGVKIEVQISSLPYLRKIAHGNLSAELFVALEGHQHLLNKASMLPTPEQERIARNEPVKVMELNGQFRMVPPMSLLNREIEQVFLFGRFRDDAEQVGYLRGRLQAKDMAGEVIDEPAHKISSKRKGVIVTRPTFLSAIEIEHYYNALCKKPKAKREKQAA